MKTATQHSRGEPDRKSHVHGCSCGCVTGNKMQASNRVFVLDKKGQPLMPCHPARARELLAKGKAVVHRRFPFVIRMKHRIGGAVQPLRVGIDPGSKVTGFAVFREAEPVLIPAAEPKTEDKLIVSAAKEPPVGGLIRIVLWLAELEHRGGIIHKQMGQRAGYRRRRRSKNLRYRAPRYSNRRPAKGTLPPSLRHRVETTISWVDRLCRWAPVSALSQELVRFDMQKMQNPEISGIEYQQGTLQGYEIREYLLEKWGRECVYCGAENVPLQVEHIAARAKGGSLRIPNLTLACGPCNQKKGTKPLKEFLKKKPELAAKILAQAKAPLRDAAAVNSTRFALLRALKATGLPVETASGGRTKFNRSRFGIPKTHALDAVCLGEVNSVVGWECASLRIRSMGRGSYQRTLPNKYGFPRCAMGRQKTFFGFRTGDMVCAVVPKGKHKGIHTGRVAVRSKPSFRIGKADGIAAKNCTILQRSDGYEYTLRASAEAHRSGSSLE